jgi:acyl-[acyl carrier protein]--UDP-N-acetylglucosamine O-acyltransferase
MAKKNNNNQTGVNTKELREKGYTEINAHKVDIDKTVFKKTDSERDMLKHMKKQFKTNPGFTDAK